MSKEPNRNVYVGHRYVPKVMGEWNNQIDYEGLSIVTHQGASYTSKKRVPVGIDILNEEFWVVTGNYDAQVEYYREETLKISKALKDKTDLKSESVTYKIPTDFIDLQEAIDTLSLFHISNKTTITLLIERGHKLNTNLVLENGDYSHYRISSVDDIVYVSEDHPGGTLFDIINSRSPVFNVLVNCQSVVNMGIKASRTSTVTVEENKGITHAYTTNLYVTEGSTAYAKNCNFTYGSQGTKDSGSGGSGILAWGGRIYAEGTDVSNSKSYGAQAAHGGTLSFRNGKANNVGRYGVRATNGAYIDCRSLESIGAEVYNIYAFGSSIINARQCNIGQSERGVVSVGGSNIDARNTMINDVVIGVQAGSSSVVNFYEGSVKGATENGIQISSLGTVSAVYAKVLNSGSSSLRVDFGFLDFTGGTVSGLGELDLYIIKGATVKMAQAKTRSSTESEPMLEDLNITEFNKHSNFGVVYN